LPAGAEPAPVLVSQGSPPADAGSITKKPWFWIGMGALVVAAAVAGFVLIRRGPSDPKGSIDPVNGN
jgi:hypothetical protein